jgi:hypothetical protein
MTNKPVPPYFTLFYSLLLLILSAAALASVMMSIAGREVTNISTLLCGLLGAGLVYELVLNIAYMFANRNR